MQISQLASDLSVYTVPRARHLADMGEKALDTLKDEAAKKGG